MVRDQPYCSKEKTAKLSKMSSNKEQDEEWFEGSSAHVAIPKSPFIHTKKTYAESSSKEFTICRTKLFRG